MHSNSFFGHLGLRPRRERVPIQITYRQTTNGQSPMRIVRVSGSLHYGQQLAHPSDLGHPGRRRLQKRVQIQITYRIIRSVGVPLVCVSHYVQQLAHPQQIRMRFRMAFMFMHRVHGFFRRPAQHFHLPGTLTGPPEKPQHVGMKFRSGVNPRYHYNRSGRETRDQAARQGRSEVRKCFRHCGSSLSLSSITTVFLFRESIQDAWAWCRAIPIFR
mmetsp:Transcript_12920/g.31482  ORF Transcript_12920/g.31482 Transcript_12920/m.31482 type:complete len:215 (-) Transcript_12920:36-680(-)